MIRASDSGTDRSDDRGTDGGSGRERGRANSDQRTRARERFGRHLGRHEYYPYPGPPAHFETGAPRRRGRVEVVDVRFPSVLPSGIPENDVVAARLFSRPGREDGQPVVLLHGLGFGRLAAWDSFAGSLASRGFPTLLVCLPHTCERTPRGRRSGTAYVSIEAETALPAYEQAVADVRAALDLLVSGRLGKRATGKSGAGPALVGLSLGAFVAVMAAAMEPRFRSLVCVLGGADLDAVVFGGTYRPLIQRQLDRAGITAENRRRARETYESYLDQVRAAGHPLDVVAPFHFFLFDPMTFAHHLRDRPALLINARFDPIVPADAARRLWLALGRPESSLIWGTHWVGGPWRPPVTARIARFLGALGPSGTGRPEGSETAPHRQDEAETG